MAQISYGDWIGRESVGLRLILSPKMRASLQFVFGVDSFWCLLYTNSEIE